MTMHKLINTTADLNEALAAIAPADDHLVLRDAAGCLWEFDKTDIESEPEGGWGRAVDRDAFPFLVLWYPGSVILSNAGGTTILSPAQQRPSNASRYFAEKRAQLEAIALGTQP